MQRALTAVEKGPRRDAIRARIERMKEFIFDVLKGWALQLILFAIFVAIMIALEPTRPTPPERPVVIQEILPA
jgi:hypothetical protein